MVQSRKKQWRKNVDISNVQNSLDELRKEERIHGKKLKDVDSTELFALDTKGDSQNLVQQRSRKKSKTLKIDEILTPNSAIEPIFSRSRPVVPNKAIMILEKHRGVSSTKQKPKVSKATQHLIQKVAAKLEKKKKQGTASSVLKRKADQLSSSESSTSIWVEGAKKKQDTTKDDVNDYTVSLRPKEKKKPVVPDTRPKNATAVKVISDGASYNPSFTKHQEVLKDAFNEEQKIAEKRQEVLKKLSYPAELDLLNDEDMIDNSDSDEEYDGYLSVDESHGSSHAQVVSAENRKTRAQRNKILRTRKLEKEEQMRKEKKRLAQQFATFEEIKKQVAANDTEAKQSKPEKTAADLKLGPHKYKPVAKALDVPLTEDLAEDLRSVKPEGNLFKDRFNSLQERGLIETRVPVGRKRKFKRKEFEIHSYKQFK